MDSIGFIYAIIAALCWGSYLVPFKKSGSQQVILFQLLMGFSIVIATTVLTLLVNFSFNLNQYGIAAGVIWALANWLSLIAIENLGLSKGVPFMASVGILFSFTLVLNHHVLSVLLFFQECFVLVLLKIFCPLFYYMNYSACLSRK